MVIPEFSVKVRNDKTDNRTDECLTQNNPDNKANQHGSQFIRTPHQQVRRFIDSSWNFYRFHKPPLLISRAIF